MRRGIDFVLEKAAWPVLLLEADGRICRANQAARRLFDLTEENAPVSLTAFWETENGPGLPEFLRQPSSAPPGPRLFKLPQQSAAPFFAQVAQITREEQDYYIMQLFREAATAFPDLTYLPPPKAAPAGPADLPPALLDAAWPVFLLDKADKMIQANSAAVATFGGKAVAAGSTLAGLLPPEETGSWTKWLAASAAARLSRIKLSLADGAIVAFRLEKSLMHGGQATLVQCFRTEMAEPVLVTEPVEFLLQHAEWPALLVQKSGKIVQVNLAGIRAFGTVIEKDAAQLEAIWSPHNRDTCQQFLNLPVPPDAVPLKFHLKSGLPGDYLGQICPAGADDLMLLQLLKAPSTAVEKKSPPLKLNVDKSAAAIAAMGATSPDSGLAHKQKLDCALQLARSVSLDFNNALTIILGHASLLLSKEDTNNPWRNSLVEIEKSAARAAEVAGDLAAFSRQERDHRSHAAFNLNTLVERTVEIFQGSRTPPAAISKSLERKLFSAHFDEAKVQQALLKIFENAVESLSGEGKIEVQTRNVELTQVFQDGTVRLNPGNYICVEITDTGGGIAADIMPRVFEPFFSTKAPPHRGLGLAWVYGVATNHGGGVTLASQPGAGTAVRFYLPASEQIVRDLPGTTADLSGTETILMVDDEDLLLTMGRTILSAYGYTVLTAENGQEALEIFKRPNTKIDLVITDLVMPNMSGRELSDHLSKLAPSVRIIWSSGYVRTANPAEQERYLQKPFSSQDLLRKVRLVLSE